MVVTGGMHATAKGIDLSFFDAEEKKLSIGSGLVMNIFLTHIIIIIIIYSSTTFENTIVNVKLIV